MKILFQYTKRVLTANKGRTLVTIGGIILSFALFTAILTSLSSGLQFMIDYVLENDGEWHGLIYQCTQEDISLLQDSEEVDGYVSLENQGVAEFDWVYSESKPYIYVAGMDEAYREKMPFALVTGRLPENENEILLPDDFENSGVSYQLGDEITLELGERFLSDGTHIPHSSILQGDQEEIRGIVSRKLTVVGVYDEGPSYRNGACYQFLTVKTGTYTEDVFFTLKDFNDTEEFLQKYFSDHASIPNYELMRYLGTSAESSIKRMGMGMAGILCVIVAFACTSLIYNAFSISLGERTRQFGLLKSIGATKRQIRWMVLFEAGLLSAVSIPLGLLLGCLGTFACLSYLQSYFLTLQSGAVAPVTIRFYTEPLYLVGAVFVGFITVFISALIPAMRANRLSPLEAIRQTADIRLKSRQVRGNGLWGKLFGAGGMLAYKNQKRNKKPYRTIIFSIATSLILFIGGGGLVFYTQKAMEVTVDVRSYDFLLSYNRPFSEEEYAQVKAALWEEPSISEATQVVSCYSLELILSDQELLAENGAYYANGRDTLTARIQFVQEEAYEKYLTELGLSLEEYLYGETPKALVMNDVSGTGMVSQGGGYEERRYGGACFKNGDLSQVVLRASNGSVLPYEIGEAIPLSDFPYWVERGELTLLLPMKEYEAYGTLAGSGYLQNQVMIFSNAPEETKQRLTAMKRGGALPAYVGEYSVFYPGIIDVQEDLKYEQAIASIFQVFVMCFVVLICLISIANITNTITTSVRLRTREFAMLKSIGISRSTLIRMITLENTSYILKALVIGGLLALGFNYLAYTYMSEAVMASVSLPWGYYGAAAAGLTGIGLFSVLYTYGKTRKGNICEELRNEVL